MIKYKTYFSLTFPPILVIFLVFIFSLNSCSKKNYSFSGSNQFKATDKIPDYTDLNYWAAHPWKKDPSDSIPAPLLTGYTIDTSTDVFFIHPTTYTGNNNKGWNAPIDDYEINTKTDRTTILYQASVFNEKCRVFAPRYRQANINAFYISDSLSESYFDIAYEDIKNAFKYYLKNYNNGRPIIIASHSQGTKHAGRLLKEFFENTALRDKLVCAYIIGMPIPDNYFTRLKPCKDSLSTGCFVGWRTFKNGYTDKKFVAKEKYNSIVINPLSWTSDSSFYPSSLNKGGILLKFNKIIPNTVSARIHHNVLWTSKPNIPGKIFLISKNYHVGDINLFYMNIRQNIAARIAAYKSKNK